MPVAHIAMLQTLDTPIALFEDDIQTLEARFPAQSDVAVSADPLVCMTPMMQNSEGTIQHKNDEQSTN